MKKLFNNAVAIFVLLIVLLLLIPLPAFILDIMFLFNITISLMILLTTMYISEALEFSIFPSLLLITTLFRLALNISSTRLILTKEGQAGAVIKTFGEFVLQGNVVVGVIIFLIIVIVQFIVITKGAERVAEVAARFTLDAMPGKQMAIDADLNTGMITDEQARVRRYKIQKEADFYGAMDGATKIVKGDAIASIIITIINFLAGTVIGMLQGSMPFEQVLSVYTIASIGDGLVSQFPALLISTATGMIVTRAASDGSLNEDVTKQFLSQPVVLIISGLVMGAFSFLPGSPKLQPILIAVVLITLGVTLKNKERQTAQLALAEAYASEALLEEPLSEAEYFRNSSNIYSLLSVEPIEIEFGYSLIPLVDEASGGNLIGRIINFRKQFAADMGFVVPSIQLHDSGMLSPNQYVVKLKGEEVAKGEILTDYFLAIDPPNMKNEIEGIETVEPAYGIPSRWITPDKKELAEQMGYVVIDPLSVMVTHMSEIIRKHVHELLTRAELLQLLENAKKVAPDLVEEVVPNNITYGILQKILAGLLKEGIPIRDMLSILESILESSGVTKDTDLMAENVRGALKRTITRKFCDNGQIKVITLDADLERDIVASITRNEYGSYVSLSPETMRQLIDQLNEYLLKFKELGSQPIVLTSPIIRVYFYRMVEQFYPDITVLSFQEIDNNVQIQALGNITV